MVSKKQDTYLTEICVLFFVDLVGFVCIDLMELENYQVEYKS